jgi:hypothetical protein
MSGGLGLAITIYLAAGVVAGTIAGLISQRKRRHSGFWTTAAFMFPPLLFLLFFMPTGRAVPRARSASEWDDDLDRL